MWLTVYTASYLLHVCIVVFKSCKLCLLSASFLIAFINQCMYYVSYVLLATRAIARAAASRDQ